MGAKSSKASAEAHHQAVQIALLTIYDMCKAADKRMVMTGVQLLEKHGGPGSFVAEGATPHAVRWPAGGLGTSTYCLEGNCSIQLSYG